MRSIKSIPGLQRWRARRTQSGQAMIYGLFMIVGAVVGLFFLFNTGQLVREKTKLVNASDAVAYSAAVMNARTLNYEAYLNRAMLANTVAIAQLVSLSSWVEYVNTIGMGGSGVNWLQYPEYWPSYWIASTAGEMLSQFSSSALENLAKASDKLIRNVLMTSQQAAYAGLIPARLVVMEEVAKANYRNDGDVAVDPLPMSTRDITGFLSRYSDRERTRFAEVATVAANKDRFVPKRSWGPIAAAWPDCSGYGFNWLSRRGGTNLIGFDEWKALDTLSEWRWRATWWGCLVGEHIIGYGGRLAADEQQPDAPVDMNYFERYDYSRVLNPSASVVADLSASSSTWGYSGLPNFYDLSESALDEDDPRLQVAVRLHRKISDTASSEGRSNIRGTGDSSSFGQSLNNYKAAPAGGEELVAVSSAEVYFERGESNSYGGDIGQPREIGSLFNPFWHVHLVANDAAVHAAQALQGAYIP